jgi:hypothetical protein
VTVGGICDVKWKFSIRHGIDGSDLERVYTKPKLRKFIFDRIEALVK